MDIEQLEDVEIKFIPDTVISRELITGGKKKSIKRKSIKSKAKRKSSKKMTVGKVCGSRKFKIKMGFCCNEKTKKWQPGYPHRKFCSKKTLSKPNPWVVRYGVKSTKKNSISRKSVKRKSTKRKSVKRKSVYMTKKKCKSLLSKQIKKNSKKYSNHKQAIAIAYSQIKRKHKNCKKHFK